MDKDEKIIEAVNYLKDQQKTLLDFALKGVLTHLVITAFSVTLAFQNKFVPLTVIQISNIGITLFAAISALIFLATEK